MQRTSAYISQTDNHIAELTVREAMDFAARCQGASESFSGRSLGFWLACIIAVTTLLKLVYNEKDQMKQYTYVRGD